MAVDERIVAKKMAKSLAFLCLNEHFKRPLHNGSVPVSKTGDYTDIFITDAEGHRLAWNRTCRVSFYEREMMLEDVADGIYDFLLNIETTSYTRRLEKAYQTFVHWKESGGRKKSKKKI